MVSGVDLGISLAVVVQAEPPLQTLLPGLQETALAVTPDGSKAAFALSADDEGCPAAMEEAGLTQSRHTWRQS